MAVTAQDIQKCLPEFASVDPDTIDKWRAYAESRIDEVQVGTAKYDQLVIFLTGHYLKSFQLQSGLPPGAMSQKRVDKLAASFAIDVKSVLGRSALAATAYGRMYLDLIRLVFVERCV